MNWRNKRIISITLSLILILGIIIIPTSVFAEDTKTLTIVHVNDVHGRLSYNEGNGEIGFGRLSTFIEGLRAEDSNVLLLSAGDTFHGEVDVNLTGGTIMVELMNKLGFDAMVLGNHDFNYGYNELLDLKSKAEFDIIAANVLKEEDKTSDFEPYVIRELENGLKVGIFGLTTEETAFKTHPDNTVGIEFANPLEAAKDAVEKLKEEEVDIVIALVHLGIEGTTLTTSKQIAEEVEGIDVIIDGHSHELLNEEINGTLLVQAKNYMQAIGVLEIKIVDGELEMEESLVEFEDAKDIVPNEEIEADILSMTEANEVIKAQVVGSTKVALDGERADVRTGETTLGNLITDAMRESTGADIAFTNGGGIRASIAEGEVTFGDIVTSFPFTNTLAVIEVTGAELLEALEHGVDLFPEQAGHFPHVSGMSYKFDAGKPVGERMVEVIVGEDDLDVEATYRLVTNDFMAAGGDGYTMFEGKTFVAEGGLLSDVLIDYFKLHGEVEPTVEGRITFIPAPEVEPEPEPEPAPEPTPEPVPVAKKYVVVAGDVLWRIARMFDTTWERLAEFNKLSNPHLIFPGQQILIP